MSLFTNAVDPYGGYLETIVSAIANSISCTFALYTIEMYYDYVRFLERDCTVIKRIKDKQPGQ